MRKLGCGTWNVKCGERNVRCGMWNAENFLKNMRDKKHKYHQQRLDNADIQTYFSRYKVPCGDISVTDTLVSLPAAAKLPSRMFISVKSPNAFTLAMGYLFLLSTRVNADTWNLTSVFRPSFSGSSTPINEQQKKQKLCIEKASVPGNVQKHSINKGF